MKQTISRFLSRKVVADAHAEFEIYLDGNPGGLNVLIFTEYINATYYISFDIPLRRLHAKGEVNLAVVSQQFVAGKGVGCWEQWLQLFQPDVVVMTRYGHEYGIGILEYFKSQNVPVIYHIDDDLLNIPDTLGSEIRKRQGADGVIETRRYLMQRADIIYASTSYLSSLLQKRFPKQDIVHGIYAPYMGEEIEVADDDGFQPQIIGYMGSKGHQKDLELVVPALERLLDERSGLRFEVFGTIRMPEQLEKFGRRIISRSVQKSYLEFLKTLSCLSWTVGIAPLADEPFNRCKAPTKFVEYTACGIPTVASNLPVYSEAIPRDGGKLVADDWYSSITMFLDVHKMRRLSLSISRKYCATNFSVSILEKQLKDIFSKSKGLKKG